MNKFYVIKNKKTSKYYAGLNNKSEEYFSNNINEARTFPKEEALKKYLQKNEEYVKVKMVLIEVGTNNKKILRLF